MKNRKPKRKLSAKEKKELEERDKVLRQISCRYRYGYTDEEFEEERTNLCISQGLSRYC